MDTRYWRTTAYLGYIASLFTAVFTLTSFIGLQQPTEAVPPEAYPFVDMSNLCSNLFPFVFVAAFFFSLRELLQIEQHKVLSQMMGLCLITSFVLRTLGSALIYNMIINRENSLSQETLLLFIGDFYGYAIFFDAILIGCLGWVMWREQKFPGWIGQVSLVAAVVLFISAMLGVFAPAQVLAFTIMPIWMVGISSWLLIFTPLHKFG